jgi:hypothetical protein
MPFSVLPIWTDPASGTDTGPLATTCRTVAEVEAEVARWLRRPRPGLRVVVSDDLTWRRVMTVRAKGIRT